MHKIAYIEIFLTLRLLGLEPLYRMSKHSQHLDHLMDSCIYVHRAICVIPLRVDHFSEEHQLWK